LKRAIAKEGIYFYELKTATLKNDFNQKTKLANQRRIQVLHLGCLTVCVTRAGAGGGTPSDWKNAEA